MVALDAGKANGIDIDADKLISIENVTGGLGHDAINGNGNKNSLRGGGGNDVIDGKSNHDILYGEQGEDKLLGGARNDVLTGGNGADKLYGGDGKKGLGKDTFVFEALSDSTVSAKGRDTIYDFAHGDRFDLSQIDANIKKNGNQDFSFIGTDKFSGKAGELRYEKKKSDTFVYGDADGDKKADFGVHLDDAVKLAAYDFQL